MSNVKDRYRPDPLSEFSEWHRNNIASWSKYIDADYIGYIDPNRYPEHAYEIYVIIELIHVSNDSEWGEDVPSQYPLYGHKRRVYEHLAKALDIPTYVVWHTSDCDEFFIKPLGDGGTECERLRGTYQFQGFLDQHRMDYLGLGESDD